MIPCIILQFAIGATYVGLLNTARLISCIVIHLTVYREWRAKILQELHNLVEKYDAAPETLDRIPFHAWDTELPLLDMTANEILRSHGHGTLLRQSIGEAFDLDGCTIHKNACVVYPMSDAHQSPEYYRGQEFSPGRIESMGDEKQLRFVAWGSGTLPLSLLSVATSNLTTLACI